MSSDEIMVVVDSVGINEFTNWMHFVQTEAALAKAQDDMTCYHNQHQEPAPEYTPENEVYLDGSDI